MYSIEPDRARALLRLRIWGFWNEQTMSDFVRDERHAVAAAGFRAHGFDVLCDVTESAIQPQDIVVAFQDMIRHSPTPARRIALITTKQLSRMQAKRIVVHDGVAVFEGEPEAIRWLADG